MLTRALRETDWPQVAALEAATYRDVGLSESLDALRSRAGAGTSFVLEAGGVVVGYVLALPWPYGRVPDLAETGSVPARMPDPVAARMLDPAAARMLDPVAARVLDPAAARVPGPVLDPVGGRVSDLHLHDMAVAVEHRGAGLGRRLAGHLVTAARERGYRRVSLVALDGRDAFWSRQGFRPRPSVPAPAGYGPGATYMSRQL